MPEAKQTVYCLLKFGRKQHIQAFLREFLPNLMILIARGEGGYPPKVTNCK